MGRLMRNQGYGLIANAEESTSLSNRVRSPLSRLDKK